MLTVGSLFSGIGGIDLGLQWAGMKTIWFVEQDKYCQKVLAKHWPGVTCYGDIKTVDFRSLPKPDLLCGGFPCQPFSVAGKRKGTADDRWLWPDFYRAICEIMPRWILVENVPGLLSIDYGRVFGSILRDLAESGFDAEWDVLSAAQFGAPHLRFRVFLVAHAQKRKDIFGEPRSLEETAIIWESIYSTPGNGGEDVAITSINSAIKGLPNGAAMSVFRPEQKSESKRSDWWSVEPNVGRVAHGIPSRVDRLKCLGNAVVPQVVKWIGEKIMETE